MPRELFNRVAHASCRGGFAVQDYGFDVLLRDTATCAVHEPEGELRLGVARLGAGAEVGEGLCGWPVFILCLNTGRTAHREGEGGDHEGAAHNVATHWFSGLWRIPRFLGI